MPHLSLRVHAGDLGLINDKTIKLEWHKVANTRTRCLRITQVHSPSSTHDPIRLWPFP